MSRTYSWYIINRIEGTVEGCNDVEQFLHLKDDEDYLLLQPQNNVYFADGEQEDVIEYENPDSDEDEEG